MFTMYFVVALVLGQLTARIRAQQTAERQRERSGILKDAGYRQGVALPRSQGLLRRQRYGILQSGKVKRIVLNIRVERRRERTF